MQDFQEPQEARAQHINIASGMSDTSWARIGTDSSQAFGRDSDQAFGRDSDQAFGNDPWQRFRMARADFGSSPQTAGLQRDMPQPGDRVSSQTINFTNPYQNISNWQDDVEEDFDEAYGGEDHGDQRRERTAEREDDRNRPVINVRAGESIQRALERAPEGAIINVEAGTYKERLNITRDNVILRGQPGAVLDYQGVSISGAAIKIKDRQNVTISGFEIRNIRGGDTPTAIQVEGSSSNIRIVDNRIHKVENSSNAHAIAVYGRGSNPIRNIEISGNKISDLRLGRSEAVVINGNVDGFKITDNEIFNCDNIAIDIIGGEGVSRGGNDRARNGVISHNLVYDIDSGRNQAYRHRCAAGIYVDGGSDIVIEKNIVRNSNFGIEAASEKRGMFAERITIRNNRLENNHLAGITLGGSGSSNGGLKDSTVENNILVGNKAHLWRQRNLSAVEIRNNRES